MPPRASRTEDSRWARLTLASLIVVGTLLTGWITYDLRAAADDLRVVREGFSALTTRVALVEQGIVTNTLNDLVLWKRVDRLEYRQVMP